MLILNVKLARHGKVPVLVADESFRKYNTGFAPAPSGDVLVKKEDIDITKTEFDFPVMVSKEKAMERYIFA